MNTNQITGLTIDAALKVHRALGPGLFESVYERALAAEIDSRGMRVTRQQAHSATYGEIDLGLAFRSDLIVDGVVIVEVKSVPALLPVHTKRVVTYLRLSGLHVGLLLNFGEARMKDGIRRVVNGYVDEA